MSVQSFLESLRSRQINKQLLRFVTGNQSADMDSVISALTFSYFHHQKHPSEEPILPLVNISREEFRLRKDINALLNKHKICSTCLFFLDDIEEFTKSVSKPEFNVVLVDHCNLQGELLTSLYEEGHLDVSGIIDHHADEGVFLEAKPRIIKSTGSCSALVFNYFNTDLKPITDKDAASLLLGPLLIDTSNMESKVEEEDRKAFAEYKRILSDPSASVQSSTKSTNSFTDLYAELKTAKKDLKGFSLYDILRKDYKQFKFKAKSGESVSVGFSSVGKSLSWVLSKFSASEVLESLSLMTKTFHLDVVVITSSFSQKETKIYTREFCFSTHKSSLETLAFLAEELQLAPQFYKDTTVAEQLTQINNTVFFKVFNQQNTAASRKQVVPVIKTVIEHRL